MKGKIKKIVASIVFCVLVFSLIARFNDILVPKTSNRYYMLEKILEENNESYDVQVYGSCHAYTSFDAKAFEENYNISSYVMANPGEIIPSTYLRMKERFEKDIPKVALIDIWGLNAYETYSTQSDIFEYYFPPNIERLPLSCEKLQIIKEYESLEFISESLPITKYKDRIMNNELTETDFDYEFSDEFYYEMTIRNKNNGLAAYEDSTEVLDFNEKQAKVSPDDKLAYETDIVEYTNKIIDLCEEYGVAIIFYRAPYISTENELRKSNWFSDFCDEKDILYIDLETAVSFDFSTDFLDYHHLNRFGAKKATDYLAPYILEAMGK